MSTNKAILILDPAHGKNVFGKCSPDKTLLEWKKSREMIHKIIDELKQFPKQFFVSSPFLGYDNEPGIRSRVDHYNEVSETWDRMVVISIHMDAAPSRLLKPDGWADNVRGTTIFTSRGETDADPFATLLGESIEMTQPNEKYRWDHGLGRKEKIRDLDREADFTVIAGYRIDRNKPFTAENWRAANYDGILIENGFMTSHQDVLNLLDPGWTNNRVDGIVKGIMNGFHALGLAPQYL